MSELSSKRALLDRSLGAVHLTRQQLGPIADQVAGLDALARRIEKSADANEVSQLRAELARLEATFLANMEALAQRLDDELEPRAYKHTVQRDSLGRISGVISKPEGGA